MCHTHFRCKAGKLRLFTCGPRQHVATPDIFLTRDENEVALRDAPLFPSLTNGHACMNTACFRRISSRIHTRTSLTERLYGMPRV